MSFIIVHSPKPSLSKEDVEAGAHAIGPFSSKEDFELFELEFPEVVNDDCSKFEIELIELDFFHMLGQPKYPPLRLVRADESG